jgi:hypothetical protein
MMALLKKPTCIHYCAYVSKNYVLGNNVQVSIICPYFTRLILSVNICGHNTLVENVQWTFYPRIQCPSDILPTLYTYTYRGPTCVCLTIIESIQTIIRCQMYSILVLHLNVTPRNPTCSKTWVTCL